MKAITKKNSILSQYTHLDTLINKDIEDLVFDRSAVLTGLAKELHLDPLVALGVGAQIITRHGFYGVLHHIFKRLKDKGAIKDEYFNTDKGRRSLNELFNFLKQDLPDDKRWSILQEIAVVSATEGDNGKIDAIEFMSLVRKLEPIEVTILFAAYRLSLDPNSITQINRRNGDVVNIGDWYACIQKEANIGYIEIAIQHDDKLTQLRLVNSKIIHYEDDTRLGNHFRLSDLGFAICEYASRYDELKKKYSL